MTNNYFIYIILYIFLGIAFKTIQAHNAVATCLLLPFSDDLSKRSELTLNQHGKLTLLFDTNGVNEPVLKGELPVNLEVSSSIKRAIVIHELGDLKNKDSIGPHFAGNSLWPHALPPTVPRHVGDIGNANSSSVYISGSNNLLWTLDKNITSVIGRSLVIHENEDNGTGEDGNVGKPLYQCVIGLGNKAHLDSSLTKNHASTPDINVKYAVADILPSVGDWRRFYGRVLFEQLETGGVHVTSRICGLEDGKHGFHVHEYGDFIGLTNDRSELVGDHYSIEIHPHNLPPHTPRHTGDMGNLFSNQFISDFDETFDNMNLTLLIGHAVIIHRSEDNGEQPTGNAGQKIALGLIGIASDNLNIKEEIDKIVCGLDDISRTIFIIVLVVTLFFVLLCIITCTLVFLLVATYRWIIEKRILNPIVERQKFEEEEMGEKLLSKRKYDD